MGGHAIRPKKCRSNISKCNNSMFHDFIEDFMQVYIDDIVIKSNNKSTQLEHLRKSFERMRKYGLKMNPLKCAFCVQVGDFLGFVVHKALKLIRARPKLSWTSNRRRPKRSFSHCWA